MIQGLRPRQTDGLPTPLCATWDLPTQCVHEPPPNWGVGQLDPVADGARAIIGAQKSIAEIACRNSVLRFSGNSVQAAKLDESLVALSQASR